MAERSTAHGSQTGDRQAFDLLVGRHQESLRVRARIHLGSVATAEEVVAEAFLRLVERPSRPRHLGAWLRTTVTHLCVDSQRRSRSEARALGALETEPPACSSPFDVLVARRRLADVLEALDDLPERHRQALELTCLAGMSVSEVAGTLGLSTVQVHDAVAYARRILSAGNPR